MPRRSQLVLGLISVFYAVGLAGHLWPVTLPWMLVLTPWFLLAAGVTVAASYGWKASLPMVLGWFVPVFGVTFFLEALGVATGAVFGPYHYSEVLGALWFGVPPVIGWNWVLVVLGVRCLVLLLVPRASSVVRVSLVALLCVGFDVLLEPVAIGLGYWVWHGGSVPLQNYFAWGAIAALGAWWAERFPKLPSDPILGGYVLIQAVFFLVLGVSGVHP